MIKVVVPFSGGKDSQACVKLALAAYPKDEVQVIFNDTQHEHPLTYKHLERIEILYGIDILRIQAPNGVIGEIKKAKRFPGGLSRFCTDRLKLRPSRDYYDQLADEQGEGYQVWLGMRSDESPARAKRYKHVLTDEIYPPHEIMAKTYPKRLFKKGVTFRLPILDWALDEVLDFVGDDLNPLYSHGFKRVGCFPCLAGGDKHKWDAFHFDDWGRAKYKELKKLEAITNYPLYTSKKYRKMELEEFGESKLYPPQEVEADEIDVGFQGCAVCAI